MCSVLWAVVMVQSVLEGSSLHTALGWGIWVYIFSAEISVQLGAADRRLGWMVAWVVAWGWGC